MSDRPGPQKSADAYRTISEVADELKLPQHVLRFWETRFPQVQPLKRAGGRRFYRPEDVALLRAVQALLYDEGYTIKGVQRLIAEFGARHVADALARSRAAGAPGGTSAGIPAAAVPRGGAAGGAAPGEVPGPSEPSFEPGRQGAGRPEPDGNPASRPAGVARGDLMDRLTDVLSELVECARSLAAVRSIDS